MDILVWGQENSLKQAAAKGYASVASKNELFERSDVLSLHGLEGAFGRERHVLGPGVTGGVTAREATRAFGDYPLCL
jgi:hypothetical protein